MDPDWLLFILRPLNNRYTWRLRLRILLAMEPRHFKQLRKLYKNSPLSRG